MCPERVKLAIPSALQDVLDQMLSPAGNVIGQPYGILVMDVRVPMVQHGLLQHLNVSRIMNQQIRITAVNQVTHGIQSA